ncbi:MAG: integrase [Methyloligella sp.]|jgi:integrase|nr:MAG: integrase [Methyloligella sp.]
MNGKNSFHARITKTVIERLQSGDCVWDTELKGFGARRQKHTASYFLKTRIRGKQRWITIGQHSPYTPDTARKQAMAYKLDPSAIDQKKQEFPTLFKLAEPFKLAHYPNIKPRTRKDYTSLLERQILPTLGKLEIAEITRADVTRFHHKFAQTPRRANMALAVLSIIMSWAEEFGYREQNSNPCKGMKKFTENKRERYLSKEELNRLGKALNEAENTGKISTYAAAAIRLLILTGARRGEILTLKWAYIDYEKQVIRLPDSKTGARVINLNEPTIKVLEIVPRQISNPYVIVGKVHGEPMVNIFKPWDIVRKAANLDDFRIHDIRHSFASIAAESGASLLHIGKLLGHKKSTTTERYTHIANNPIKELNETVGGLIKDTMKNI